MKKLIKIILIGSFISTIGWQIGKRLNQESIEYQVDYMMRYNEKLEAIEEASHLDDAKQTRI